MALFKTPCLWHISTVPIIDTILCDASTRIRQTEVVLTELHGEVKNVTNHD